MLEEKSNLNFIIRDVIKKTTLTSTKTTSHHLNENEDSKHHIVDANETVEDDEENTKHAFVILAKCLNAFPKLSAAVFDVLKDKFVELMNQPGRVDFERIVQALDDVRNSSLRKCQPLVRMLEARRTWLIEHMPSCKPSSSSSMPLSLRMPNFQLKSHPGLEEFFRSESNEIQYNFKRKSFVRSFLAQFTPIYKAREDVHVCVNIVYKTPTKLIFIKSSSPEQMALVGETYRRELEQIAQFLRACS